MPTQRVSLRKKRDENLSLRVNQVGERKGIQEAEEPEKGQGQGGLGRSGGLRVVTRMSDAAGRPGTTDSKRNHWVQQESHCYTLRGSFIPILDTAVKTTEQKGRGSWVQVKGKSRVDPKLPPRYRS